MSLKNLLKITGIGGAAYASTCIKRKQEKQTEHNSTKPFQRVNLKNVENYYFPKSAVFPEWYASEEEKTQLEKNEYNIEQAINETNGKINCKMTEVGAPCIMIAVSVNGKTVMKDGFGYVDLEKRHSAGWTHPVRIGLISLNITLAVLAKLWKDGKLDPEEKLSKYIPENGEDLSLTVKELIQQIINEDDISKLPLLIRLTEEIVGEKFEKYMAEQFKVLGMENTYLENSDIIYWRANHYVRDKDNKLRNAPLVKEDITSEMNYLSSVLDLVRFGNILLYSFQRGDSTDTNETKEDSAEVNSDPKENEEYLPGYLSRETMPMVGTDRTRRERQYGFCTEGTDYVIMTGYGIGASSVLLIIPESTKEKDLSELPKGVVVSIICNLQDVDLEPLAAKIAYSFLNLSTDFSLKVEEVYNC